MDRRFLATLSGLALALAACNDNAAEPSDTNTPSAPGETGGAEPGTVTKPSHTPNTVGPAPGEAMNDGYPDLTPAKLTPEAERTVKGARNVLLSWSRAIDLREYDQAWAMMSSRDHAKWSRAAWTKLFADLDKIAVAIPDGTMEGAAGSSYYTSQASITGTDKDGRAVRYEGPVVLRRVNDVPGATAEQLRWQIDSVTLDWVH